MAASGPPCDRSLAALDTHAASLFGALIVLSQGSAIAPFI
jgi:hypothetical protein